MLRPALLVFSILCFSHLLFSQNPNVFICSTDELLQQKLQNDPGFKAQHEAIEQKYSQWATLQEAFPQQQKNSFAAYTLPVVVHVIHQNGDENISDLQIQQGIQQLNAAFANIGYFDNGDGFATPFQFCLARRKPDGTATSGINRVVSPLTSMIKETQDQALKDLVRWDTEQYINIWLVAEINSQSQGSGVAGYAYLPSAHGADFDGIVMESQWFGSNEANTGVLIHEMGHYLGLFHTFEGGCDNDDCIQNGDRVCDTPPDQSTAWTPCGTVQNTCSTDVNSGFATDQNDMTINYMDYATLSCYNAFTAGQSDRMEFFLLNMRQSLLASEGCKDPCNSPVTASFTSSLMGTLPVGTAVNFTNTSTNGANYEWRLGGIPVSTSGDWDHVFDEEGLHIVTLKTIGNDTNCTAFFSDTFFIVCALQTSFSINNLNPSPGDVITCVSTGNGASQFEWTINGVVFGSAATANVTIPGTGVFTICLNESDAWCSRSFCKLVVVEDTTDCDDNLFRLLFTPTSVGDFVPLNDGSYLAAGGYWADSSFLLHLTQDGDVISGRSFNVFPGETEYIFDLEVVSGGYVIGVGISDHLAPETQWKCFAFKYDVQNQSFVWIKTFQQTDFQLDFFNSQITELPDGNYLVNSQNRKDYARSFQLILDDATGDIAAGKEFWELNTAIALKKLVRAGQQFYTGGYRIGATTIPVALLSAWDANGQPLWSKEYAGGPTPLYSFSTIAWNNHLYMLADGADTNRYFVVIKTDLYGQLIWSRRVDVPYNTFFTNGKAIVPVSDGFIVHVANPAADKAFFYKLDENGQLLWSRVMEMPTKFILNSVQAEGNDLLLIGFQTISFGRSVLIRINSDKLFGGTCKLYAEATATAYDFPVTVTDRVLQASSISYTTQTPDVPLRPAPFILQDWCPVVVCPEICDNNIDDDSDGYVDCYDVDDCPCVELPDCAAGIENPVFSVRMAWQSTPSEVLPVGGVLVANLNPAKDNMPEIIVPEAAGLSGGLVAPSPNMLIYKGGGSNANNPDRVQIPGQVATYTSTLFTIGDVNADGTPELVVTCYDNRIRVFSNYQPGASPAMQLIAVSQTPAATAQTRPYLADFDADGLAEIYAGNEIFAFDFSNPNAPQLTKIATGGNGPQGKRLLGGSVNRGTSPVAVDLLSVADCNGDPDCEGLEIAAGYGIYSVDLDAFDGDPVQIKLQKNLNTMTPGFTFSDGNTAVGDINLDGQPDILVVGNRDDMWGIYVWNKNGLLHFFEFPNTDYPWGGVGPIAIGDVFDDTGAGALQDFPEIVVNWEKRMLAFNLNKAGQTPAEPYWWSIITDDNSGGTSGATLFDLEGDGQTEVIYRGEKKFRILYGGPAPFPPGVDAQRNKAVFTAYSGTMQEYPVVADIDNDGQAEIVVAGSDTVIGNMVEGYIFGRIKIFASDPLVGTPWLPARSVWNQYNYHVVNVNDDLTIPKFQQPGHLEFPGLGSGKRPFNTFLQQIPLLDSNFEPYLPLPDAVVAVESPTCAGDSFTVNIQICNHGSAKLPAGTPLRFYSGDPTTTNGILLPQTPALPQDIAPDSCFSFQTTLTAPPAGQDIYVIINDDGSKNPPFDLASDFPTGTIAECDYLNNKTSFPLPPPPSPLELGPDIAVCQNGVWTFDAGSGFQSYQWSTFSTDPVITVYEPGTYWVEAKDICGNIYRDTVTVTVDKATLIELGADTTLCANSATLQFNLTGFAEYHWFPEGGFSCTHCGNPSAQPSDDVTYSVVAKTSLGCISTDSIRVKISEVFQVQMDTAICAGAILNMNGVDIPAGTSQTFFLVTQAGCDSTIVVHVAAIPIFQTSENRVICTGDSVLIFGEWQNQAGVFSQTFSASGGCDSVHTVALEVLPAFQTLENRAICTGDSVLIFGEWQSQTGVFSQTFSASGGCDSVHTVALEVLPAFQTSENRAICTGDSVLIFGEWQSQAGVFSQTFSASGGCDSVHTVALEVLPEFQTSENQVICTGDSVLIFGEWQSQAGVFSQTFSASGGCDSVHTVALEVLPEFQTLENRAICTGDSVLIFGEWQSQAGVFSQTFSASGGCDSVHTVLLKTNALPDLEVVGWMPALCPGDSNGWLMVEGSSAGLEFSLDGGDFQTNSVFEQLAGGTYIIHVRDSLGCVGTKTIIFPTPPALTLQLPGDTLIQPGQPVQLLPLADGSNLSYAWSPAQYLDCSDCPDPVATPPLSVTYTLTIKDDRGCSLADSVTIRVQEQGPGIFIPNVIRPGSGGGNDLLAVFAPAVADVREVTLMEVYDRWGGLLFRRQHFPADGSVGWDGTARGQALQPGVYVYLLEIELADGTTKKIKGDVTLLR